jgi:uncharacterized protein YjiK
MLESSAHMRASTQSRVPFIAALVFVLIGFALVSPRRLAADVPPTAVDLFTYVRVGRFDLPEPTRTPAPPNSLLAQEASGVTYNWDTDTLFVVGDGGTSVVQVTKAGILLDSMTLAPGGSPQGTEFYDTEGISYLGGGQFVFVEERYRQVVLFTYVPGGTLTRAATRTVKLGTTIGNVGFEGISLDPSTGGFIIVKEKDPESIFQTAIDFNAGTATNGSPSATSSTDLFAPALAGVLDFSDVFALSNLPSLAGHPDASHLLVISQESGQIINVSRTGVVSSRLTIVADPGSPLSVPDMTMEGVTMDRAGNLYVVNENGGGDANHPQLWVYAPSSAQNKAPTGISLQNVVSSIPENTSTATPLKLADIIVADDGIGNNVLGLGGTDAASFQIIGTSLFLKAGTHLDRSIKPIYFVNVTVDDPGVGNNTPDASTSYTLDIAVSTGGNASLIISEVAPWSSGNSTLAADWFEVTNVGTVAQDITGWKMDDDSNSFASAVPLQGITSIAPGESVIFIESATSKRAQFLALWFGANPPNLQVGFYSGSGVGLSTGSDQVNLFDIGGTRRTGVSFGTATTTSPLRTFDNGIGLSGAISAQSATGVNGAFSITDGAFAAIGSPGTIGAPTTPTITIAAIDATASENAGDTGTFRVTRTGSVVGPLTFNYTISGTASASDYAPALTGVGTIPAGSPVVDIVITPVDDSLFETSETLTLTLSDTGSYDVGAASAATITISDNDPPDTSLQTATAAATASTTASFTFGGSAPLAAIARFECSLDGAAFATCASPRQFTSLAEGSHTFQVRAVGTSGVVDPSPATFTWIVDLTNPTATIAASTQSLWPVNGKPVSVRISGTVADALAGIDPESVAFRVIDKYGEIQPTGRIVPGGGGQYEFWLPLEASRRGTDKDGREYKVIVTFRDLAGNQASVTIIIAVPHDQGK